MTAYLTYEEYIDVGGKVSDEDVFDKELRKAQHLLDYITFNRIPLLPEIPECVKDLLVEFIDKTVVAEVAGGEAVDANISSYSNTVEKITYKISTDTEKSAELKQLAYRYLPDYLTARGVSFDVEKYLQSANNNNKQTETS